MEKPRYNFSFTILFVIVVAICFMSNLAACKISPFPIGGLPVDCGVYLFPLTYILMDIFNEKFGFKNANILAITSAALNFLMLLFLYGISLLPAYSGWDGQAAFQEIFGFSLKISIFSFLAYICSHLVDNFIFQRVKKNSGFFLSSLLSTIASQLVDVAIFEIAYIGVMETSEFIKQAVFAYVIGVVIAVILTLIITPIKKMIERKPKTE